jgi:hypothetical protein
MKCRNVGGKYMHFMTANNHLTPSGILHMATFMTLDEAYIGIETHFNLWSYFF